MAEQRFLLKDMFDRDSVGVISRAVDAVYPKFDPDRFDALVFDAGWPGRELKARMRHITNALHELLPPDYPVALEVLRSAAPLTESAGFAAIVLSDFVEAFGVDDYDASIPALEEFTKIISAEFAIRPFILRYPDRTIEQMRRWSDDLDTRVRRLASEGCRPRLPWGMGLGPLRTDPAPIIPILANLRHDESQDVRRSVANNLNDISKDHPALVVDLLSKWQDGSDEVRWITRHALRGLAKKGDRPALALLGYEPDPLVVISDLAIEPARVPVGADARLRFTVASASREPQPLMIDAIVSYARRGGKSSIKVFKLKQLRLEPGTSVEVSRKLTFRQLSTRTIHPGTHTAEIQVNGAREARIDFVVTDP